jgi:MerR family copper efflux transcriptional regulator
MNIGQASLASGVSPKMIRHYEKTRLLPKALRNDSGYRSYGEKEVQVLRFLRRARNLGFSVDEMRDLLSLWEDRNRASADVKRLVLEHIVVLEEKAEALRQMTEALSHLAASCPGDDRPVCPIIHDFATKLPTDVEIRHVASRERFETI